MKQTIILLTMIILGIAISAMILQFEDTAKNLSDNTRNKMEEQLGK